MKKFMKQVTAFALAFALGITSVGASEAYANNLAPERAYGDEVTYTVNYHLQNDDGSFITVPVEKKGSEQHTIDVEPDANVIPSNYSTTHKTPVAQSFQVVKDGTVDFYYYKWITATINYFKGTSLFNNDIISIKGIDGETFTAPLIDIEGYKKPEAQKITLSISGNNVVNYYYEAIPTVKYTLKYIGYDPLKKEIVPFLTLTPEAKSGTEVTPAILTTKELEQAVKKAFEDAGVNTKGKVFDYSCYDAPTTAITKTVAEDGSTVIEYNYNKVRGYYKVNHYLEQPDGGYKLDEKKSVKLQNLVGAEVTPEVATYDNYTSPKAQTVKVTVNDDVVVDYYYKLKTLPEAEKGYVLTQDNMTFTVTDTKNYTVSAKGTVTNSNVVIPSSVTIRGKEYKVTAIADNAFKGSKMLKNVTIPATVTSIGKNAFKGCTALSKVTIKGTALKAISNSAFENCKKLKSITIPKNVTKIGSKAFSGCKALSKVTFKGTKVKSIGKNAFKGIKKKATFKVPKAKKKAYKKLLTKKSVGYVKTWKIK